MSEAIGKCSCGPWAVAGVVTPMDSPPYEICTRCGAGARIKLASVVFNATPEAIRQPPTSGGLPMSEPIETLSCRTCGCAASIAILSPVDGKSYFCVRCVARGRATPDAPDEPIRRPPPPIPERCGDVIGPSACHMWIGNILAMAAIAILLGLLITALITIRTHGVAGQPSSNILLSSGIADE